MIFFLLLYMCSFDDTILNRENKFNLVIILLDQVRKSYLMVSIQCTLFSPSMIFKSIDSRFIFIFLDFKNGDQSLVLALRSTLSDFGRRFKNWCAKY